MSSATLDQAAHLLKLISDKRISRERLQAHIQSGLLSDLLTAHPDHLNRDVYRRAMERASFPIVKDSFSLGPVSKPLDLEEEILAFKSSQGGFGENAEQILEKFSSHPNATESYEIIRTDLECDSDRLRDMIGYSDREMATESDLLMLSHLDSYELPQEQIFVFSHIHMVAPMFSTSWGRHHLAAMTYHPVPRHIGLVILQPVRWETHEKSVMIPIDTHVLVRLKNKPDDEIRSLVNTYPAS